jgi:hypothetical protein
MKKIYYILILCFLSGLFFFGPKFFLLGNKVNSFDSCQKAGYPILDSYPEQCQLPNGKSFTKQIDEPIVCTMDAKMCLDGSYVGRIAPNCDFAPCPGN